VKKAHLLSLLLALLLLCAPAAGAVTGASLRVSGTVSAISSGTLTVTVDSGQTMSFRLAAATTYANDGQAADFSALAVGESVRVKYHLEANGSLKAKEVDVETDSGVASAPVSVRGSVVSVTPSVLVLKNDATGQDLTMRLSPTTSFEKNGQPAVVGDLEPGESVKVKYRVEPDRSLKVQKVKIEFRQSVAFQLEGAIVQAGATSVRVRVACLRENGALVRATAGRTVTVMLSASTAVLRNGRKARAGALVVGDHVHVVGTLAANVFAADRIVAQRAVRKR
jgi:hypothetical protein